jgi:hypothetical protein
MNKPRLVYSKFFFNGCDFIFQHRLLLLCLLLLARFALEATSGVWFGDFWEHSAVVNEFMARPFDPKHPQLKVEATHAFLNPYGLSVAAMALLFKTDAITALASFGIVNFVVLSLGLRGFIATLDPHNQNGITFYALILALLLWGQEAWLFSGFYNIKILNGVLPYPSTLALGLSLICLTLHFKLLQLTRTHAQQSNHSIVFTSVAIALIAAIVLLIHPLTALFLWVGLASQIAAHQPKQILKWLHLALIIASSIIIATCWPYFSIMQLMLGAGAAYHPSNASMYLNVLQGIWPILVCLPLILWQANLTRNRGLLLTMLGMLVLYGLGYYSSQYSFGRGITFVLLFANILIAQTLIKVEGWSFLRSQHTLKIATALALCVTCSLWAYQSKDRILTVANSLYLGRTVSSEISYKHLNFLKKYVARDETVLTDIDSSWLLPTLSGKAIATAHPLAFVSDWYQRKIDLLDFFAANTSQEKRRAIAKQYQPQYLLLNKSKISHWKEILNQFNESDNQGTILFENADFILLRLNPLT